MEVVQGLVSEFYNGVRLPIREEAFREFTGVLDERQLVAMSLFTDSLGLVTNVTGAFDRKSLATSQRVEDIAGIRQSIREDGLDVAHINGKTNPLDSQTKMRCKCESTFQLYRKMLETGIYVADLSDAYTGHKLPKSKFGKKKKTALTKKN